MSNDNELERPLQRGDHVVVTFKGQTTRALVVLVSPNGRSILLMFNTTLGGYVNLMPLLWDEPRQAYLDLLGSAVVTLTPVEAEVVH